ERSPLLLQHVAALGRQADLQTPSDQLSTGRAQLLHGLPALSGRLVSGFGPHQASFRAIVENWHRGGGPSSTLAHPSIRPSRVFTSARIRRVTTSRTLGSTQREPFDKFTRKRCSQL